MGEARIRTKAIEDIFALGRIPFILGAVEITSQRELQGTKMELEIATTISDSPALGLCLNGTGHWGNCWPRDTWETGADGQMVTNNLIGAGSGFCPPTHQSSVSAVQGKNFKPQRNQNWGSWLAQASRLEEKHQISVGLSRPWTPAATDTVSWRKTGEMLQNSRTKTTHDTWEPNMSMNEEKKGPNLWQPGT